MKTIAIVLNLMLIGLLILVVSKKGQPVHLQEWLFCSLLLLAPLSSLMVLFSSGNDRQPHPPSSKKRLKETPNRGGEPDDEDTLPDLYDLSDEKKNIERLIGKG